jgi:hypothetical protein
MSLRSIFVLSALTVGGGGTLLQAERELTTDRPDATESPFTVEPGRVQLEVSAAAYERNHHPDSANDAETSTWNVSPLNIRIGLTPDWELQIVHDGYIEQRTVGAGRIRGWSDLTLRAKYNFYGNDSGASALGIMPFIVLPTGTDALGVAGVEGGIILPFAADLPKGWGFGAMSEIDWVRNATDSGFDTVWLNTVTTGRALTDKLGGFVELTLAVGPGRPAATFNWGFTYGASANLQFDLGVNLALTRAAPDLGGFAGFSVRY